MHKRLQEEKVRLGVCYYPEHWSEEMWENDFKRMKDLGFTYVRMGEFAWTVFEPEEGKFTFELFDKAIDLAWKIGLKIILGTPTATPPAWLTTKYPDVLNVSQDGLTIQHGERRHYNYNSKNYKRLSSIIVTELAKHYKNHPSIVGWQIDNEFNCEINVFYSEADHTEFRNWVINKYETLDKLNEAWGTVFWNQTYTNWNQIYLTRKTNQNSPNPHHALDEKRFISDSVIAFAKLQADILRQHTSNQWISTNGMFGHLDNHRLTEEVLDFFAYDSYPNFGRIIEDNTEKPLRDRKWSWNLSEVRSISPNFAIFEQQAGPGGWVTRMEQPSPKPGQIRLWTFQSIAHGADMVLYFRWRTATKGTEIYWHGINDYHNQPNRRIKEVEQVSKEIKQLENKIAGSFYQAEAAIVLDYNNQWDGELDNWYGPYATKSKEAWFKAFQYNHVPVDAFNLTSESTIEEIKQYKVLIYPHPAIVTKETATLLETYVHQGGKIVFGCRTGYKDKTGQAYMLPFPGYLANLTGITIDDFTRISPFEPIPVVNIRNGKTFVADDFNEVLQVNNRDVEVIGTFDNSYYQGKAALVKRNTGAGTSYYFGGVFDIQLASFLLLNELKMNNHNHLFEIPENIELAIRKKEEKNYYFLLNYSDNDQEIFLKQKMNNLLKGTIERNKVVMRAFDILVLEEMTI
ncbi:beta-galactosidase [Bacillus sp. B1-b2]|uniref:beta-galactosidase n=1 Tax=Bacillus sp. B1-b2 TaxID=2653201 RepID=UPI0012617036|nr:beta-galactosidase [Bacillus sp. B1-b2]KAB7671267.1 beta-galactosidase [Bacillus sp. B1-b2]